MGTKPGLTGPQHKGKRMETIYQDEKRTVSWDGEEYTISPLGKPGKKVIVSGQPQPISKAPRSVAEAVRAAGLGKYVWFCGLAMPAAVADALVAHWDARRAEWQASHPGATERREIYDLVSRAAECEDEDYRLSCSLRLDARARLVAWSEKYPAEWREEHAERLEAVAQHERDLAVGAMLYDCDGSLSEDDQKRRAAEFVARAVALEAESANIRCER